MAGAKPMAVRADPHPFVKAFPTTAATITFVIAVVKVGMVVWSKTWPYRRELTLATGYLCAWWAVGQVLPAWWALGTTWIALSALLAFPGIRSRVAGWLRCGRTTRWLRAGLANPRSA